MVLMLRVVLHMLKVIILIQRVIVHMLTVIVHMLKVTALSLVGNTHTRRVLPPLQVVGRHTQKE